MRWRSPSARSPAAVPSCGPVRRDSSPKPRAGSMQTSRAEGRLRRDRSGPREWSGWDWGAGRRSPPAPSTRRSSAFPACSVGLLCSNFARTFSHVQGSCATAVNPKSSMANSVAQRICVFCIARTPLVHRPCGPAAGGAAAQIHKARLQNLERSRRRFHGGHR